MYSLLIIGEYEKTDGANRVNAWSATVKQTVCTEQIDRLFFYLIFREKSERIIENKWLDT